MAYLGFPFIRILLTIGSGEFDWSLLPRTPDWLKMVFAKFWVPLDEFEFLIRFVAWIGASWVAFPAANSLSKMSTDWDSCCLLKINLSNHFNEQLWFPSRTEYFLTGDNTLKIPWWRTMTVILTFVSWSNTNLIWFMSLNWFLIVDRWSRSVFSSFFWIFCKFKKRILWNTVSPSLWAQSIKRTTTNKWLIPNNITHCWLNTATNTKGF